MHANSSVGKGETGYAAGTFTAAQIASALGVSPQAVRRTLLDTAAAGVRVVNGNEALTWSTAQLPESLRRRLQDAARQRHYRSIDAMLQAPVKIWEPPIPLERISTEDADQAVKLRQALLPWLLQQHNPELPGAEIEDRGVTDYARHFGHTITTRYWRELFMRTLARDGGAENWGRLEIYLPNNPREKREPARLVPEAVVAEFNELAGYIEICQRPPSEKETQGIWLRAFEEHERLAATGFSSKKAARLVRDLLFARVPVLAESRDALLKAFGRKLARWQAKKKDPGALVDGRKGNGGDDYEFPQEDLDVIEFKIVFHYGKYAPAWREAFQRGELSQATRERYRARCKRKSYVPQKLISTLGKRPLWLYLLHRRRKDFNSLKAHFDTVYDGLHTLDCISADDVTLPVWFWYQPDPAAPPVITRGQCLVFIDLVSKRVIGWSLQPEKNYNALVIYTQTARLFALKGIPRALLFEHGIWHRARIITGTAPHSISEVTQGLKSFGVEFFHADTPEGKWEVEQVMGLIQNLMEGEPGYCGRDERRDRPDWIKKQLAEVQSSNGPHPSKYFYSFDEWNRRLAEIFEQYNATRQGGRLMQDRSPDEVYAANWNAGDPPTRLGAELMPLFARVKFETVVGPDGVKVQSGNRVFKYFGGELKHLVGYPVIVWFDPEFPDMACVTDMNQKNPIAVQMHTGVPRLERLTDPDGTSLADACRRRESQASGIVARYNVLKDKFELPYRRNLVAARIMELSQAMERQKAESRDRQSAEKTRRAVVQRNAGRLGIEVLNERLADADEGARLMLEAQREETASDGRADTAATTEENQ